MLSIIIPTFNEVENIIPLIESLISVINNFEYEIIVIDDDSPDGTSDVINNYMSKNDKVKLITRIDRSGLSSAIKEGLIFARGDYLLVLDGDGQHDPTCIRSILNKISEDHTDLVIASRFLKSSQMTGLSGKRSFGSRIANNAARISLNKNYINLTDYLSGCFCLRKKSTKSLFRKIEINGFKFLFELLSVSKGRLLVKEVPLLFKKRLYGNSKLDIAIIWDFLVSILHNFSFRILPRRAISFGLVGLSGICVQFLLVSILTKVLLIGFYKALPFAVVGAASSNFLINNLLTFRFNKLKNLSLLFGYLKFLLVASLPIIANIGITTSFYNYVTKDTFVAQMAGIVIVYAWNYLASSSFIWNKSISN